MAQWPTKVFKVSDLLLDPLNPRIPGKAGLDQGKVIELLLEREGIVELSWKLKDAVKTAPIERIVVLIEKDKKTVVEGNRRTCVAKLLSMPSLIPAKYISKFPALTESERRAFETIEGFVTTTRKESLSFISRRHLETGTKRWSTVAQHRIVERLLSEGMSPEEIQRSLEIGGSAFQRLMLEYSIMREVKALPGWTEEERTKLASQDLKHAPLTYFLRGKRAGNILGLKVDKAGRLQSVLGAKDLRGSLRVLAKEILIETGNGYSTRTSADEIIEKVLAGKPEGKEFVKKWNEGLKSSGLSPVSNVSRLHFFRKLDYKGNNGVLRQIVFELNGVDYGKHPTAASALLRLLFERVLMLCIDNTGRHKDYKAWAKSNYRGSDLDMVIKYVIKHESDIFVDSRQVRFVEKIRSAKDNYLDQVLHGASKANTTKVKMYCDEMRDFVEKVLSGQNLRDKNHASNS